MKKEWPKATEIFSEVLDNLPEHVNARLNRAIANLQNGDLDAARDDYEQLLENAPHEFKIHYGLADIADKQKRPADAIEHFTAYLKAAPKHTSEYTNSTKRLEQLRSK